MEPIGGAPQPQEPGFFGKLFGILFGRKVSQIPGGEERTSNAVSHVWQNFLSAWQTAFSPRPAVIRSLNDAFKETSRNSPCPFVFPESGWGAIWKNRFGGFSIQFPDGKLLSLSEDGSLIFDGSVKHKVNSEEGRALLQKFLSASAQALMANRIQPLHNAFWDTDQDHRFILRSESNACSIWRNPHNGLLSVKIPGRETLSLSADGSTIFDGPTSYRVDSKEGKALLKIFLEASAPALDAKGPGIREQAGTMVERLRTRFSKTSYKKPFRFNHNGKDFLLWRNPHGGFTIRDPADPRESSLSFSEDGLRYYKEMRETEEPGSIFVTFSGPIHSVGEDGKEFLAAAEAAIRFFAQTLTS